MRQPIYKAFLILLCTFIMGITAQAQNVTGKYEKQSLEKVLSSIEQQTGLSIIYKSDEVDVGKMVSATFDNTNVKDAVASIIGPGLEVTIHGRLIIISKKASTKKDGASKLDVAGLVVDENGEPIPGASVLIQGTKNGSVTDANGNFKISGVDVNSVLEISFLGYQTLELRATQAALGRVALSEDRQYLNEVVVVGYGTQRKSDITGSVASVKAEELLSSPASSTSQALQGKVAGVVVQNNSGDPSGAVSIRVRGANSLTYGNDPLIIIDGVQDGNLGSLNPNQIESMEVLKDAAALSVYGAKGANGVILVTTKNGKEGKFNVSYNGFVSFDQVRKMMATLGAKDYAILSNQSQIENGLTPYFTDDEIAKLGEGVNWQKQIFRNAISHTHNISVSGGNKVVSYYLSGNIANKQGIIKNSDFQTYSFRGNFKIQASPKIFLNFNTFASYDKSNSGDSETALISALQWSPTKDVYDKDGRYTLPGGGIGPNSLYNPLAYALEYVNQYTTSLFSASMTAEYRFTDYLKLSSLLSYKTNSRVSGYFDNQVANQGPAEDVNGSKSQSRYMSLQSTTILSFDKTFNKHLVQATAVYELLRDQYNSTSASSKGIPVGMGYNGVNFGTVLQKPWVEYSSTTMQSFMLRANYSYDSRYMVSASARFDGASQLADGHKWDHFLAASVGWNIHNEKFMKDVRHAISELKVRASYGSVGNAAVPAYSSHLKFYPGLDANNNATLSISQLGNSGLKWERTNELNVGIESRYLNGRISFAVEYYDKKTTDLLMWQKVPSALGVESILTNVGAVSNKGVELSLGGSPVSTRNFNWEINWSANYNRNRILALDGLSDTIVYSSNADYPGLVGSFVQMVGQPMGTFLGYEYAGVWKSEEASTAAIYGAKPGDAKYVDRNMDGIIDKDDIGVIGNAQPVWNFGFNNTFTYKGFDLNVFFQGVAGNYIYNQNRVRMEGNSSDACSTSPVIKEHWTKDHQTDVPAFSGSELTNSSRWVEKGDYLRLKNITLGYRFDTELLKKARISALRLYVSASNLWTITSYQGFDPESSMGRDAVAAGVDRGVYPSSKSVIAGIDISF